MQPWSPKNASGKAGASPARGRVRSGMLSPGALALLLCVLWTGCWYDYYEPKSTGSTTLTFSAAAVGQWEEALDGLLRKYVDARGLVDYDGLAGEREKVEGILVALGSVDPQGWSEAQKLAFWINAYNICMLWNILSKYPGFSNVLDHGDAFFRRNRFLLAGQGLTLDELEHRVLRRKDAVDKSKDNPIAGISVERLHPGIHVALSCAARSCPPLRNQIWRAQTVEADLQAQLKKVLNDPAFVSLAGGKPSVLELFDWFFEDFQQEGKTTGAFFAGFVTDAALQEALRAAGNDKSKYDFKPYDWTLNKR